MAVTNTYNPQQYQNNYNYIPNQTPINNYQYSNNPISERIWVQGENAAKAYLVSRNTEQVIWDSENPVIYIKTVDMYGKPSMVTLDYTIRKEEPQNDISFNKEIGELKTEFNDFKNEMREFMKSFENRTHRQNYKKEVRNNA